MRHGSEVMAAVTVFHLDVKQLLFLDHIPGFNTNTQPIKDGYLLTIRREGDGGSTKHVTQREAAKLFAGCRVPQAHLAAPRSCQGLAIRRKGHTSTTTQAHRPQPGHHSFRQRVAVEVAPDFSGEPSP